MANKEPRKHHVVPSFYLAGFTSADARAGKLHVFDYHSARHYVTTPAKACRRTDFYRFKEPGVDPSVIENILAHQESEIAPFVRKLGKGEHVDDVRQIDRAVALASQITVRGQRGRQRLRRSSALTIGTRLRDGEITEAQWENLRLAAFRNGTTIASLPPFEDARRLLINREWFPEAPEFLAVISIPEVTDELFSILRKRPWELHVTDAARNGGFITSNAPLVWGDLDRMAKGVELNQDISDPDVEVTFPVSRNATLVSYRGARSARLLTTDSVVAHINSRTLHLTDGLIFHAHSDFLLHRGHLRSMNKGSNYFAYVRNARRRGIMQP